ncbi:ABC transporter G family member 35-like [Cryptomeria japonica]|uniref:ABC transporter G family member 35-like n=1 Tax=Cryptomeria japonica TaxID=3369 RepID=UPI0027D9FE15|nr:ABC transporter G family member 35-like [Cryptomeria japonica]
MYISTCEALGMPQETIPEEDEEGSHADKQTPQEIKIISSVGRGKKGMVLPFQPLAMAFKNVSYFIDMPAFLLTTSSAF